MTNLESKNMKKVIKALNLLVIYKDHFLSVKDSDDDPNVIYDIKGAFKKSFKDIWDKVLSV